MAGGLGFWGGGEDGEWGGLAGGGDGVAGGYNLAAGVEAAAGGDASWVGWLTTQNDALRGFGED